MELEKVATIIEKLTAKVDLDDQLEWSQIDDLRYGVRIGKSLVSFRRYQPDDPFEDETMFIEFLMTNGDVIESFSDSELRSVLSNAYSLMRRLWKTAKMRSTGFDGVLDDILGDLD